MGLDIKAITLIALLGGAQSLHVPLHKAAYKFHTGFITQAIFTSQIPSSIIPIYLLKPKNIWNPQSWWGNRQVCFSQRGRTISLSDSGLSRVENSPCRLNYKCVNSAVGLKHLWHTRIKGSHINKWVWGLFSYDSSMDGNICVFWFRLKYLSGSLMHCHKIFLERHSRSQEGDAKWFHHLMLPESPIFTYLSITLVTPRLFLSHHDKSHTCGFKRNVSTIIGWIR